jgi:DNA polymerase-1
MTGSVYDIDGVKAKFGVGPELIIDYLALMGDKVDNIPGVPGVGEKTALGLLVGIGGGLDVLYANLEKVPELPIRGAKNLPAKLLEHKEMAYLSYQLATIKLDVPLNIAIESLHPSAMDVPALLELYAELEFKTWRDELLRSNPAPAVKAPVAAPADDLFALAPSAAPAVVPALAVAEAPTADAAVVELPAVAALGDYQCILEQAQFEVWLEKLRNAELIAFDTGPANGPLDDWARRATATFSLKTGRISKVGLKISLCYVLYGVLVGNTEKTLYRTRRERRMADVTRDRKTRGQEGYAPGAPAINYRDNGGLTVTQYGRNEFPHTILMHGSRPPKRTSARRDPGSWRTPSAPSKTKQ